jgi:hypothetical protein
VEKCLDEAHLYLVTVITLLIASMNHLEREKMMRKRMRKKEDEESIINENAEPGYVGVRDSKSEYWEADDMVSEDSD